MRWTRIIHIMAALRGYLNEIIRRRTFTRHIDIGERRMLDDENDVVMLSSCLKEWVPGLWDPDEPLTNIATGKKADLSMVENVRSTKKRGEEAMNELFLRITIDDDNQPLSDAEYYDKIKRQAVISFNDKDKKEKCDTIAEDENKSFGEIFSCFEGKTLNLRWIMQWPVTSKPYALCAEDGKTRSKLNHLFRNKLQQLNPEGILLTSPMDISVSIVDAM